MHLAAGFFRVIVCLSFLTLAPSAMALEMGGGYSRQLLNNTAIEQYEMVVRQPLAYKAELSGWSDQTKRMPLRMVFGGELRISSVVEMAMAVIREADTAHPAVGKFTIMPQLVLRPHNRLHWFFGLGAGLMGGDTAFTEHDLGGNFFLASKIGTRLLLGDNWGSELVYYHQSNGGIYDHNASLNMCQFALFYRF
ncbi:MAG: acyloxyacyl hydrolase [Desulforhopalus sp.]|nr:acyloxyacyl hydrolase [Desulforhopalus sp.]